MIMTTEIQEAKAQEMSSPNGGSGFNNADSFALIQRQATLLSASTLVPKQFQGAQNLPNCVIALNMAQRIGADPLMVMQNLYVVHGNPSWSAQFLIASFNDCGRFSAIRYEWSGEEGTDSYGCRATAIEKESGMELRGPVITIQTAKKEGWYDKKGSKWQTIPDLMLMYRSAAWLVRTHAPEIAMGLKTVDENEDIGPDVIEVSGASRSEQIANLLTKAEAEPEAPAEVASTDPDANPYIDVEPFEGESANAYVKRINRSIGESADTGYLDYVVLSAGTLEQDGFLVDMQHGALTKAVNDRSEELKRLNEKGRLV